MHNSPCGEELDDKEHAGDAVEDNCNACLVPPPAVAMLQPVTCGPGSVNHSNSEVQCSNAPAGIQPYSSEQI